MSTRLDTNILCRYTEAWVISLLRVTFLASNRISIKTLSLGSEFLKNTVLHQCLILLMGVTQFCMKSLAGAPLLAGWVSSDQWKFPQRSDYYELRNGLTNSQQLGSEHDAQKEQPNPKMCLELMLFTILPAFCLLPYLLIVLF